LALSMFKKDLNDDQLIFDTSLWALLSSLLIAFAKLDLLPPKHSRSSCLE
jgi:hypothetical protein